MFSTNNSYLKFYLRPVTKTLEGVVSGGVGMAKSMIRRGIKDLLRCQAQTLLNSAVQEIAYRAVEKSAGAKAAKTAYYSSVIIWTAGDPIQRTCETIQSSLISAVALLALKYFGVFKAMPALALLI